VGGLIGHSTGRRSLSTVGGTHVCPPNRGERSTRMAATYNNRRIYRHCILRYCLSHCPRAEQLDQSMRYRSWGTHRIDCSFTQNQFTMITILQRRRRTGNK